MKRAWPYALALAVVVTGCYLALAPLLRSLNPGPTTSATRVLGAANTITVGSAKPISLVSPAHGSTQYASAVHTAVKKKTAKKGTKKVVQSTAPDFATSTNTTQSSGISQSPTPPAKTSTTTSSKKSSKGRASSVVGGSAPQDDNAGLAGQTNGEDSVGGGTSSAVGP